MKEQRLKTNEALCDSINAELNQYPTVTRVFIENDPRYPLGLQMSVAKMKASRNSTYDFAWLTLQSVFDENCTYRVEIDVNETEVWKDPNKGLIQNTRTGLIITYNKVSKNSHPDFTVSDEAAFELQA